MYVVPVILIVLIAIGIFFGPVLALILLVLALIGLGLFKFLGPGTEPEHAEPPAHGPGAAVAPDREREAETGMWGERRP